MPGVIDLPSLGRLIATRRYAQGLTLAALAAAADVGRSTLAALESGKLPELGFVKVARICAAVGIALETRPPLLRTVVPGRYPTNETIEEMIRRGNVGAWRDLVEALRKDETGRLASRVRRIAITRPQSEPNLAAFIAMLPILLRRSIIRIVSRRGNIT